MASGSSSIMCRGRGCWGECMEVTAQVTMASWFETRGAAALLTMRVKGPHAELANLILRSALLRASRRMAASGLSWFETAQARLLTMRRQQTLRGSWR
jgi:hypothetical protein